MLFLIISYKNKQEFCSIPFEAIQITWLLLKYLFNSFEVLPTNFAGIATTIISVLRTTSFISVEIIISLGIL